MRPVVSRAVISSVVAVIVTPAVVACVVGVYPMVSSKVAAVVVEFERMRIIVIHVYSVRARIPPAYVDVCQAVGVVRSRRPAVL